VIIAAPFADKTALRAHMRQVRAACARSQPDAAERAAGVLPLDRLPPLRIAAGYWALGSEMSPLPLLARLAAAGVSLALPIAKDRQSGLTFRRWSPGDVLIKDAFGIPSPGPEAQEVFPDMIVAPLLAFDRRGGRLGQGAGHYDRTLEALRAQGPVFVIGLAYAGQELDQAPQEAHDQPLDGFLTETDYFPVGG
jgi:5-formyltetrahydrofolate cyclo-ligase